MVDQFIITLISVIIGAILGFGGSLYIQKWTQERAWKREYGLKTIEKIYALLYDEMLLLKGLLKNYQRINTHPEIEFPEDKKIYLPMDRWNKIKSSYLYHMILDKEFRVALDDFYKSMVRYTYIYDTVGREIISISQGIRGGIPNLDAGEFELLDAATLQGEYFGNYINNRFGYESRDEIFRRMDIGPFNPEEYFEELLTKANKNKVIQEVRIERDNLLERCQAFLVELASRIEEPWKV